MFEVICKGCAGVWISNTDDDYCDQCVISGVAKEKENV